MSRTLHDHLVEAARDLDRADDLIRWAHTDGYWPAAPGGTTTPRPADTDEHEPAEKKPADRDDLGVGNRRARIAYTAAARHLVAADVQLAEALRTAGQRSQPALPRVDQLHHLEHAVLVVAIAKTRVAILDQQLPDLDRSTLRLVALHVHKRTRGRTPARGWIDRAVRTLDAALAQGPGNGEATGEPYCRICAIRPEHPKEGGRCKTCATWRHRNGFERPTRLDDDELKAPREAAVRRRLRGEGWGAA